MPLVVGLGNPGRTYQNTPHNIGFAVVDILAQKRRAVWKRGRGQSRVATVPNSSPPMLFLKPFAYMNLSGEPVRRILARYRIPLAEMLVVCDDVNLPLGQLRLRLSGSAGGHNGLLSLIDTLETESFARLRVGVGGGEPGADLTDYVLRKFSPELHDKVAKVVQHAADATLCFFLEGAQRAMNQFNRDAETATLSPDK